MHACAAELSRQWSEEARADDWWAARGLEPGDWHALAANTLVEVILCVCVRMWVCACVCVLVMWRGRARRWWVSCLLVLVSLSYGTSLPSCGS